MAEQPSAPEAHGATAQVTLTLPADLADAVERAVRSGQAASFDQLVTDALRHEMAASAQADLLQGDVLARRDEIVRRFRAGVQAEVAAQLAAGHPVFSCGLGADTGKLFMDMPDGRRFEYQVRADGTRDIVREVPR